MRRSQFINPLTTTTSKYSWLVPLLVFVPLIVAVDFFLQTHAPIYFQQTIYNPRAVPLAIIPLMLVSAVFLAWYYDHPLAALGGTLVLGGCFANALAAVFFGAVADYIPEPSWLKGSGCEFNFADFCIASGIIPLSIVFFLSHTFLHARLHRRANLLTKQLRERRSVAKDGG